MPPSGALAANLATKGIEKVGEAIKSIPEAIQAFAERGETIQKTAATIGISADALQRLDYAAKIADGKKLTNRPDVRGLLNSGQVGAARAPRARRWA